MTSVIFSQFKRILLLLFIVVLMLAIAVTVMADDKHRGPNEGDDVGFTVLAGDPLTINVGKDASYQVKYDDVGQVYYHQYDEADAGLFLWYDGVAVGPDFRNHADGSAGDTYSPWENVAQSAVTGSGTTVDPWVVETDVMNASTGASMTVGTIYVDGNDYFRINWQICHTTTAEVSTFLAADYYLQGSDDGFGFYHADSGSVGGYNEAQDWFQVFTPITPADHYFEGYYGDVWSLIGEDSLPGNGFNDTIVESYIDNGAGLQWDTTIDGCSEFSAFWSFGDIAIIPTTTSVSLSDLGGSSSGGNTLFFVGILAVIAFSFVVVRQRLLRKRA